MVEGIIYRCRCGIAWRDLPEVFGPWGRDEQQWLARSVADRKILVIAMEERHVASGRRSTRLATRGRSTARHSGIRGR
jgi:transposase